MVWGAISYGSRSLLVFIAGNLNAAGYIANVLESVAAPYLRGLINPILQQDNARLHTTRVTAQYLDEANVVVLSLPTRSPDLSPIEHIRDMLGNRLGNLPLPTDTLRAGCINANQS